MHISQYFVASNGQLFYCYCGFEQTSIGLLIQASLTSIGLLIQASPNVIRIWSNCNLKKKIWNDTTATYHHVGVAGSDQGHAGPVVWRRNAAERWFEVAGLES